MRLVLVLGYRSSFWSHAEFRIELFSILDVSYLPNALEYIAVSISDCFDFGIEYYSLLDTLDVWQLFLDSQVIGLGERAIFADL